jgi:hypothetical protein
MTVINLIFANKACKASAIISSSAVEGLSEFCAALKKVTTSETFVKLQTNLQLLGWQHWQSIDRDNLAEYFTVFGLDPTVESKQAEIMAYLTDAKMEQNTPWLASAIGILKQYEFYENNIELLQILINLEKIEQAEIFATNAPGPELLVYLIRNLSPRKHAKFQAGLIKANKLDPFEFPQLIAYQKMGEIKAYLRDLDWMLAEETYSGKFMGLLLKALVQDKKYSEAKSLAERHLDDSAPEIQAALSEIETLVKDNKVQVEDRPNHL